MTGVEPICWGLRKHTQLLMPTLDTTPPKIYSPFTVQIQTPYIEQPLSQMCINIQKWASELSLQHPGSFLCCIFNLSMCTEWSKKDHPLKVNSRSLTCTVQYSHISLDTVQHLAMGAQLMYLWLCTIGRFSAFEHRRPVWQSMLALPAWQSAVRHCARVEPKTAVVMCHILWDDANRRHHA